MNERKNEDLVEYYEKNPRELKKLQRLHKFEKMPSDEEFKNNDFKRYYRLIKIGGASLDYTQKDLEKSKEMTDKEFNNLWNKDELKIEALRDKREKIDEKINKLGTWKDEDMFTQYTKRERRKLDRLTEKSITIARKIEKAKDKLYSKLEPGIEKKAKAIEIGIMRLYRAGNNKDIDRMEKLEQHPLRITISEWAKEAEQKVIDRDTGMTLRKYKKNLEIGESIKESIAEKNKDRKKWRETRRQLNNELKQERELREKKKEQYRNIPLKGVKKEKTKTISPQSPQLIKTNNLKKPDQTHILKKSNQMEKLNNYRKNTQSKEIGIGHTQSKKIGHQINMMRGSGRERERDER